MESIFPHNRTRDERGVSLEKLVIILDKVPEYATQLAVYLNNRRSFPFRAVVFAFAEEAAEYESGESIILTENHAHAWAEYYLEGVGWIPFEVTPGYMDDELEKAAFSTNGESSKRYEQSELPETNVEQDRPKDDITEAKKDYAVLIAVSVSAFVLAVIAAAVYVFVMRKNLKKALLAIDNADNKTGAAMRFGYAQKLSENAGIDAKSLGYDEAFAKSQSRGYCFVKSRLPQF